MGHSELAPSAALNTTLADMPRGQTLDVLKADALELVLLAPEQPPNEETLARLRSPRRRAAEPPEG